MLDIADGGREATQIREEEGGACHYIAVDVGDEASIESAVSEALRICGRIDILVNNAARFANLAHTPFGSIETHEWDAVMTINVRGPWLMAKHVTPSMLKHGAGKIVNVGSAVAFKGLSGMSHYVTSKAALLGLTRTLALELGPQGVNVNTLAPGLIKSSSIAQNDGFFGANGTKVMASRSIKREGYPQDLVGALLFLCCADSDFVNGQTLVVDGGSVTL
jgi:NAD(P)-dependent dehydrogenase (short-subunit alcohol dehydrogenase family)